MNLTIKKKSIGNKGLFLYEAFYVAAAINHPDMLVKRYDHQGSGIRTWKMVPFGQYSVEGWIGREDLIAKHIKSGCKIARLEGVTA